MCKAGGISTRLIFMYWLRMLLRKDDNCIELWIVVVITVRYGKHILKSYEIIVRLVLKRKIARGKKTLSKVEYSLLK